MKDAAYWIDKLGLEPHPEGGYYVEVYKASESIAKDALPERFSGERAFSTSIYFLLEGQQVSKFHRIKSDELWHFYEGSGIIIYTLDADGVLTELHLGSDIEQGEAFQVVVPAGVWFGAVVKDNSSFALVGCTVAPGFHFDDFELAEQNNLIQMFPQHTATIQKLTTRA